MQLRSPLGLTTDWTSGKAGSDEGQCCQEYLGVQEYEIDLMSPRAAKAIGRDERGCLAKRGNSIMHFQK